MNLKVLLQAGMPLTVLGADIGKTNIDSLSGSQSRLINLKFQSKHNI
jgi:hypothetical protein